MHRLYIPAEMSRTGDSESACLCVCIRFGRSVENEIACTRHYLVTRRASICCIEQIRSIFIHAVILYGNSNPGALRREKGITGERWMPRLIDEKLHI